MLTQDQISHFKNKLIQERQRISQEISELKDPLSEETLKESVGELSSYDNQTSDLGNETFEREKDIGLVDNLTVIQSQIARALERISDGSYGYCAVCGREIPVERLEAVPYAVTCLEHADAEFDETREDRPVEEDRLSVPFHRTFTDEAQNQNVGFDGEDSWQSVARYGDANSPQDVPDAIGYDEVYVDADEDIGIVEETDGIIDVTEGEEDQDRIIFPDPRENPERKPHKQRFRERKKDGQ